MTFTNFIKRPVLSTVISIFFVLLGIIGLMSLPIEQYPDIAPPTISIQTSYQGADAQTVLNSVITPLEESINGVENMTYIESTATNAGMAMLTVYFKQGTDPNMAAVNVQNRVSQAQALLPAEVTRVGVTVSKRQSSNVVMYSLTTDDGRYDDEFLTNYNNINIVPMLKRINGVGDVHIPGMKTYSMRIWLQPDKMKQYGLVPSDISGALAEQNIEAAPGSFGEQSKLKFEYTMRYKGRLKTPEEYGNIIISSNTNGQTLHLRDVAKVELGGLMYSVAMRNNGQPAVLGMVNQVAGSNATQIADDVKAALADAQKTDASRDESDDRTGCNRVPFCIYRGSYSYTGYHTCVGILRCVCLLARLPFDSNSYDCCASSLDWYVLLPMGLWFLHQFIDTVGIVISDCHRCG